jgi:hypothetical protein
MRRDASRAAAIDHDGKRGLPSKQLVAVGEANPVVGKRALGVEHLEVLVNSDDERDAREGIERQRAVFAALVLVECRASRPAEQPALLID